VNAACAIDGTGQALEAADPCAVVIFGASGDLAKRKLLPALFNLAGRRALPDAFRVVGVGRRPMSDEAYRDKVREDLGRFSPVPVDPALWAWFAPRVSFAHEPLDRQASFDALAARLTGAGNAAAPRLSCVFYLATPPEAMPGIVSGLAASGLLQETSTLHWRRVILEKPFGHDLASARALNAALRTGLAESQVYRIDHYLGKETVQNLMAFRFANGIFEPIWNRRYVDHVQITVAETVGVEDRGAYYDTAGALRDMVQNHMFQLLSLTAMEPPSSFDADAVRDERVKVLQAIRLGSSERGPRGFVRGQYTAGQAAENVVAGYRGKPSVPAESLTETYVAMRLRILWDEIVV
jgi:glucose-6-phosphate 1-dehydrogenase